MDSISCFEEKDLRIRLFWQLLQIRAVKRWRPLNYHVLIIKILCKFTCITNQIEGICGRWILRLHQHFAWNEKKKQSSHSAAVFIGPLKMKSTNSKLLRRSSFTFLFCSVLFTSGQCSSFVGIEAACENNKRYGKKNIFKCTFSRTNSFPSSYWLHGMETAMNWIPDISNGTHLHI